MKTAQNTYQKAFILDTIAKDGGAYISTQQNKQPNPDLRIASIRSGAILAIGANDAAAEMDFMRQWIGQQPPSGGA